MTVAVAEDTSAPQGFLLEKMPRTFDIRPVSPRKPAGSRRKVQEPPTNGPISGTFELTARGKASRR